MWFRGGGAANLRPHLWNIITSWFKNGVSDIWTPIRTRRNETTISRIWVQCAPIFKFCLKNVVSDFLDRPRDIMEPFETPENPPSN